MMTTLFRLLGQYHFVPDLCNDDSVAAEQYWGKCMPVQKSFGGSAALRASVIQNC
jgi:hypothetical protein